MNTPQNNIAIPLSYTPLNQNQNNQSQMYNQQNTTNESMKGLTLEKMDLENEVFKDDFKENNQTKQLLPIYSTEKGIVNPFSKQSIESLQQSYNDQTSSLSLRKDQERALEYNKTGSYINKINDSTETISNNNLKALKLFYEAFGYDDKPSIENIDKEEKKETEEEVKIKREESDENLESNEKIPKRPKTEEDIKITKKNKKILTSEDKKVMKEVLVKYLDSNNELSKTRNEGIQQALISRNQRLKDIDSQEIAENEVKIKAFGKLLKYNGEIVQAYLTNESSKEERQKDIQILQTKLLEWKKPEETQNTSELFKELIKSKNEIDHYKEILIRKDERKKIKREKSQEENMEEEKMENESYIAMLNTLNQFISKEYRNYIESFKIENFSNFSQLILNKGSDEKISTLLNAFFRYGGYTMDNYFEIHKKSNISPEQTKYKILQLLNLIESDYVYIFARKEENPNAYNYLNIHSISNDFFPENMINDRNKYRQFLFEKYNVQQPFYQQPMQQPQMFSQQPQYTQQPYMQQFQQPVFTNSSGGFSNVNGFTSNPFMNQQQQQYVPQQNTTQFTNQTQYQQPSNGMQNQQPDINIQKTTMPTGSSPNMTNNSQQEFRQEYSHQKQEVPQNTSTNNTYQVPEETNSNDIYTFKSQINKADLEGNNRIATLLILYTELMDHLRKKLKTVKLKEVTLIFSTSLIRQGYGEISINELNTIHKAYMTNYK